MIFTKKSSVVESRKPSLFMMCDFLMSLLTGRNPLQHSHGSAVLEEHRQELGLLQPLEACRGGHRQRRQTWNRCRGCRCHLLRCRESLLPRRFCWSGSPNSLHRVRTLHPGSLTPLARLLSCPGMKQIVMEIGKRSPEREMD